MAHSSYVHVTTGRLRLKVPKIKRSDSLAGRVEDLLVKIEGVTSAEANPITGNVLVRFDSNVIDHDDVISCLHSNGFFEKPTIKKAKPSRGTKLNLDYGRLGKTAAETALQTLIEIAVKRAIFALV